MKSVAAACAALLTLLVAGCGEDTNRPERSEPGDRFSDTGVTFFLDAHDVTDTTISLPIELILTVTPLDPTWNQSFEDPDTGTVQQLHPGEPLHLTKRTPYGAALYFPVNQIIDIAVTIRFFGPYGTVGICAFKDLDGAEIPRTRKTYGIYDQLLRNT